MGEDAKDGTDRENKTPPNKLEADKTYDIFSDNVRRKRVLKK